MKEEIKSGNGANRAHDRSPGQTAISVSIDRYTLDRIDRAAKDSGRTRSNFIRYVLRASLPK